MDKERIILLILATVLTFAWIVLANKYEKVYRRLSDRSIRNNTSIRSCLPWICSDEFFRVDSKSKNGEEG